MKRLYAAMFLAAATAACGPKSPESLCSAVPAPTACQTACDPSPGATNTCPGGYHCSPDGKCDAQCTQGGAECGTGSVCSNDGYCNNDGTGMPHEVDANCPAVHFTPTPVIPSIELLLDRSGSMAGTDISPNRYAALRTGLTGSAGAVTSTQAQVYFGAALFSGDQNPCLTLAGYTTPRALNNATAIDALIAAHNPGGQTPTADAITQVTQGFAANPPPAGSPPIILLATDGEPNSCSGDTNQQPSIDATKAAFAAGIKTYIVGLALNTGYLQKIANAGIGQTVGNAPYYSASNPSQLVTAFNSIIAGAISCDLTINQHVDPGTAPQATVTLNGAALTFGSDWSLDANGMTIHILGAACTTLKSMPNAIVDATFPCGSVIF